MEALRQQFQTFLATQNQQNQNPYDLGDEGPRGDDFWEVPRQRCRASIHYEDNRRQDTKRVWESGRHTKVPEFHGSLQPEEFID